MCVRVTVVIVRLCWAVVSLLWRLVSKDERARYYCFLRVMWREGWDFAERAHSGFFFVRVRFSLGALAGTKRWHRRCGPAADAQVFS